MIDKEALYLDVEVSASSQAFDVVLGGGGEGRFPYYDGAYEVTPTKAGQTLKTENKSMKDDLVINPIFYAETINQGGGYTAVIGTE